MTYYAHSGTYYNLVKDSGGPYPTPDEPHWKGEQKAPACFKRSSKMKVKVLFRMRPGTPYRTVWVKGNGPGNLEFKKKTASVSGQIITDDDHVCENEFKNEIDFFDKLNIAWTVSLDDGATWQYAGTTSNQVYIVRDEPACVHYHTVIHHSCKQADGEKDNFAQITSRIWALFAGKNVVRVTDNHTLTYYKSYTTTNMLTPDLLKHGDGDCNAWARLFLDMLKAQNYQPDNNFVTAGPTVTSGAGAFLVREWSFPAPPGKSDDEDFPFLNIPEPDALLPNFVKDTSYDFVFKEVTDSTGIPGQGGVANPASFFEVHSVAVIEEKIYDASYGLIHDSFDDIDPDIIAGYVKLAKQHPVDEPTVGVDLNDDGDALDMDVPRDCFFMRTNPAGNQLRKLLEYKY